MTRSFAIPALGALLILSAPAALAGPLESTISEVQEGEAGPTVLSKVGSGAGVRAGQSVEVRRNGRTIGYGSVSQVFKDLAMVTVGTVVGDKQLQAGDTLVFLDSGYTPGGARKPPASRPAAPEEPAKPPAPPEGKVVGVRDGVVLLDFGRNEGLEVGDVVELHDGEGKLVGKISIELVGANSAGGLLQRGRARMGFIAKSIGRPEGEGGIDFVDLDFLGAVADIEHPTRHRAPCHVGVPVRRVMPGSPAQAAGLGRGDRIISVDGLVVRDIAGVRERIQARQDDRLRVTIIRGDRILTIDVDFRKKR